MTSPPVVLVEWEDAYAPDLHQTWVSAVVEPWKPLIVRSAGFLVYDGPEGVRLTDSLMTDFTGQKNQIPRGMIRSVTYLVPQKPRKPRDTKTG